jgi:1-acyl-sn-glycerol-3-phosphate acyltransferase
MFGFRDRNDAPGAPRLRPTLPLRVAEKLDRRELRRLRSVRVADAGHGYDVFGMHPDWVAVAVWATRFGHDRWFRVTAHGAENLPRRGRAILAANHSGILPIDGAMLYADVVARTDPPRVPRPIADTFVPALPFVSTFFARIGVVGGTRGNVQRLLEADELLMVFPEGATGLAKPAGERYHLGAWHVGHAELAIRHRAPVVPVAIIGAEEQWPLAARLDRLHLFGAPFIPLPATPLPFPVHMHIHYGAPLLLEGNPDDPGDVTAAAGRVRDAVQRLVDDGLRARKGLFT